MISYVCAIYMHMFQWLYMNIHTCLLKKITELLFKQSFKLKIFLQNFFSMHAVLRLKCPNALLPSPSHFPKPLLFSRSICLFYEHAISVQFRSFEGWEVIYLSEALCQQPHHRGKLLSLPSKHQRTLTAYPGEACMLRNPLFSPHSWCNVDRPVLADACCLQTSSSWSHARDLSATLELAGICHHVQLHTIVY